MGYVSNVSGFEKDMSYVSNVNGFGEDMSYVSNVVSCNVVIV